MPYQWNGTTPPHPNQIRWQTDSQYREKVISGQRRHQSTRTSEDRKRAITGVKYSCSICHEPGHTHNRCPTLVTVTII